MAIKNGYNSFHMIQAQKINILIIPNSFMNSILNYNMIH
jgi:hypothetical protein